MSCLMLLFKFGYIMVEQKRVQRICWVSLMNLFVRPTLEGLQLHRAEWTGLSPYTIGDGEKSECRRERFFQKDIP
jgi:hypothetical protein